MNLIYGPQMFNHILWDIQGQLDHTLKHIIQTVERVYVFFKHRSILLAEYSLQYNAICMYSTQKEKGMLSNHPNLIKADGQT